MNKEDYGLKEVIISKGIDIVEDSPKWAVVTAGIVTFFLMIGMMPLIVMTVLSGSWLMPVYLLLLVVFIGLFSLISTVTFN